MMYTMLMVLVGLVMGMMTVVINYSPFYGAFCLVLVSSLGCFTLAIHEGSYLSIILFLIYLGGMLVVFAYCAALEVEFDPHFWGQWLSLAVLSGGWLIWSASKLYDQGIKTEELICYESTIELTNVSKEPVGLSFSFSAGGPFLLFVAWNLLMALFVVLELVRGSKRGTMRPL
uniref:NADH-ubiquinone oxidoreductase chain 6 n=1 Tax=Bathygadus antrodes TaxID=332421 RepID=Q17U99_9TELE|nr:NADH dehydrogenase subunit 6 [Bathygadus favosus]YP_659536.1 NADH dehydrogenase subunit 6 [Bathygadus antrodes]WMI35181.1 NADH dehydrogenase subunit 6 [Bathygadus favosus]BAE96369.1 NADH dehydrogenase subunit 6 [Bathygadus antrodes]